MAILHAINWLYVLSGFCVGFLVGLTGVGGGSLMTPLLILLFGVHATTAVGTDLIYASVTKLGGSVVHSIHRTIDWQVVLRLASGSIPAALLTVTALHYLDIESAQTNALVTKILGGALLVTSSALIFRRYILGYFKTHSRPLEAGTTRTLTIVTGAVLGVLVTISSVGAGALGMTVLIILYPNLPIAKLVGSDIAHAVPLTLVAGAGHLLIGTINLPLLGSLLIGSLPGIMLASNLAPRTPENVLRYILAGVLFLVGLKLLGLF